jgi:branched-chain amino acid transport system substrate-binding protein
LRWLADHDWVDGNDQYLNEVLHLFGWSHTDYPAGAFLGFQDAAYDKMACEKIFADLKTRNLTSIALIWGTDAFGKSMRDQCVAVASKAGITVAIEESYGPRDSDMTPQLTNIRNKAGIQAVLNADFGQGPAIVTRNYRQLGITLPLYQSHGVASSSSSSPSGRRGGLLPRRLCGLS